MERLRTKLTQQLFLTMDSMQTGVSKNNFQETGKLTAEEFVTAGDFIVQNFPSWSWASGLPEKQRKHLPAEKQFLITKNGLFNSGEGLFYAHAISYTSTLLSHRRERD